MHWMKWAGILLIVVALLSAFSITIIPALVFTGPLPVLLGIVGTYIYVKHPHER